MEERNDIIGYTNYEQYKTALQTELQREAEGFVRIGYLLKVARDTSILRDSGYATVNEFAAAEFDLDASQVSRFMNINDRFSEGGYSERLEERFRGIGYAKLSIMLTLPDAVNAEITDGFSKSEIQAIKEEVEAEKKITDIEVMLEGEQEQQKIMETLVQKAIHQLGYDQPELYIAVHSLLYVETSWHDSDEETRAKRLHEVLAPAGESISSIRLQGIGRVLLSVKEPGGQVTLTNIRSGEKETYPWAELEKAWLWIIDAGEAKENWSLMYKEPFPEKKEEIAPVQQAQSPAKSTEPVKRKQPKVTKAPTEKRKPAAAESGEPHKDEESQLPGQTNIEQDFPQWMPDETQNTQNETENDGNETVEGINETLPAAVGEETALEGFEEKRLAAEKQASKVLSALVRYKHMKPTKEDIEATWNLALDLCNMIVLIEIDA